MPLACWGEKGIGEAEYDYRMLIPGDCLNYEFVWHFKLVVDLVRGGIRKFVYDADGPAFLKKGGDGI